MHFSLFWPRENWGGRKKVLGGGGERREGNLRFPFLASPPPPRYFHQCCARPNFCAAKKRKTPPTGGKPYGNACYAGYISNRSASPELKFMTTSYVTDYLTKTGGDKTECRSFDLQTVVYQIFR